eukprot:CAMPEP_0183332090 /NCGR_PEP_ID=MMETSP0164_2-20130417/1337_1 /TAXON_ID=221442 /ORGANISM="Coccolithus pelagicus ssp braarudi, Strain PLY182g" /LENGTH=109 /DNA_ID=CAMNT_0025500729 /DNA_START=270 /DNA_END=596 /DNA_ORIENTATION=-
MEDKSMLSACHTAKPAAISDRNSQFEDRVSEIGRHDLPVCDLAFLVSGFGKLRQHGNGLNWIYSRNLDFKMQERQQLQPASSRSLARLWFEPVGFACPGRVGHAAMQYA